MNRILNENILNDFGNTANASDQYLDITIDAIEKRFQTPGLVNKLFSGMVSDSGHRFQLDMTTMYDLVCQDYPGFSGEDFDEVVRLLKEAGLVNKAGGDTYELSSNSLAQRVLKRIESELRVLQKVESFIADRYEMNQESGYLLNEEELNYIDVYIKQLNLSDTHKQFIEDSREEIVKARRRRRWIVTGIYLLITAAAIVSLLFGLRAIKSERIAKEEKEIAEEQRTLAEEKREEALAAQKLADIQKDSADAARVRAEIAQREADSLKLVAEASAIDAFEQKQIAEENAALAEKETARAKKNEEEAENQRLKAEEANRELEVLYQELEESNKNLVVTTLAKDLAKISIEMGADDREIKALLAKSVYDIHNNSEIGNPEDPTIVKALYEAVKTMETSPDFDQRELGLGPVRDILLSKDGKGFYSTGGGMPIVYNKIVGESNYPGAPTLMNVDQEVQQYEKTLDGKKLKIVYQALAESSDGRFLIMAGSNPHVKVLDKKENKLKYIRNKDRGYLSLDKDDHYNPSKVYLASSYMDTRKDEFLLSAQNQLHYLTATKEGVEVVWSHNVGSETINATAFESAEAFVVGTDGGKLYWNDDPLPFNTYIHPVTAMCFLEIKGMRHLAVGYQNGMVRIFKPGNDPKNPYVSKPLELNQHNSIISALAFSKKKGVLAVGSYDKKVSVWNMSKVVEPQYAPILFDDFDSWVTTLDFLASGNTLLVGSQKGKIRFLSLDLNEYAKRICQRLSRGMSASEWEKYYKNRVPFNKVCE
jgi:WD40 repeat protein